MRMKVLAILALIGAFPAAAQEKTAIPDFGALSDTELYAMLVDLETEGFRDPCQRKVPFFAEVVRRNPTNALLRNGSLTAQAFCAYEENRHEEGLELLKQAERAATGPTFHGLGLYFAVQVGDGEEALARLRAMGHEGLLDQLPDQQVFFAVRIIQADGLAGELDELAYELTDTTEFERLDPDLQGTFATAAIRHAVGAGDLSRIESLLQYDADPSSYLNMLSDRAYAAAWPQIEQRAGENLAVVADAFVRRTSEQLAEAPEDRDRLSRYAHALHFAGRYQEAVDVARNWRPERDNLGGLQEGDAWALNIEAYALDALGRREEADAVFDQLATLPADEHYWVVNFVINRAARLVGQGRWEEGLAATELARSVAAEYGSTYAKMLIARDRTCALQRLGRADESVHEAEYLVEQFAESPPVAATGLLCVGKRPEVEQLLASALSDEVARNRLIYELQDPRFELFYTPSVLPQVREVVFAEAALRDEAFRYIRLLPDRFLPISYIRRMQIAARVP